jgi:hypothetical protein
MAAAQSLILPGKLWEFALSNCSKRDEHLASHQTIPASTRTNLSKPLTPLRAQGKPGPNSYKIQTETALADLPLMSRLRAISRPRSFGGTFSSSIAFAMALR